jgi:HSP20 family molecular chaperone IbpA
LCPFDYYQYPNIVRQHNGLAATDARPAAQEIRKVSEFAKLFDMRMPRVDVVDGSKANANLKDGMLELTLPKVEKAKRHTVKIN